MEVLNMEGSEDTPTVILDKDQGQFELAGRSFPEFPIEYYALIIDWMEEYSKDPNPKTEFTIDLEYFNSASAKQIYKLLAVLENLSKKSDVLLLWKYAKEDTDMLSSGERYAKLVNVQFEFVAY